MSEKLFQAINGAAPTTASQVKVTTGNTLKTMLQLSTPATTGITIVEWGISFDGFAAALPITVELLTCTGAATVTAFGAGDITSLTNPLGQGSLMTLGTTASGYTSSGEGTPAAVDVLDAQLISPMGQYVKQWPQGREPEVAVSRIVRVRVLAGTAVNAFCYIIWSE